MFRKLMLVSMLSLVCGCGGGHHHHGDYVGAAEVSITATSRSIDTVDRTFVKVVISKLHQDGIALKIRFPGGLTYVPNSSSLKIDGQSYGTNPDVNVAESASIKASKYIVYYFSHDLFEERQYGELSFELEAKSAVKKGYIEVDADVDDPLIDNSVEFNVDNPEFQAESIVGIKVSD